MTEAFLNRKCKCEHVGQCPVNDWVNPLCRTYPDGTKIFRQLSPTEQRFSRITHVLPDGSTMEANPCLIGDSVVTDGEGNVFVVARALDPERAVAYARSAKGPKGRCRGWRKYWRKKHPVPEEDRVITAAQVEYPEFTGSKPHLEE